MRAGTRYSRGVLKGGLWEANVGNLNYSRER